MKSKQDELFQERIDELLIIEHKAELRSQELTKSQATFHEQARLTTLRLDQVTKKISDEMFILGEMSKEATKRMQSLILYYNINMLSIIILMLLLIGSGFWLRYLYKEVNATKVDLWFATERLKYAPTVIFHEDISYVRIEPKTEKQITQNGEVGTYARVWRKQSKN